MAAKKMPPKKNAAPMAPPFPPAKGKKAAPAKGKSLPPWLNKGKK